MQVFLCFVDIFYMRKFGKPVGPDIRFVIFGEPAHFHFIRILLLITEHFLGGGVSGKLLLPIVPFVLSGVRCDPLLLNEICFDCIHFISRH